MTFRAMLVRLGAVLGPRLRPFGPAVAATPAREMARAAVGVALALGLVAGFLLPPQVGVNHGFYLVGPLAASSVLLFVLPNSPLAQPWSALVGNTVSAVVAVAVLRVVHQPVLGVALCVSGALLAMMLLRALHPPGGAVAMIAALFPEATHELGFRFALTPIGVGTAALILLAIVYARATGRVYPMRQAQAPNAFGTKDRPAPQRLGLGAEDLAVILRDYRQSANLGPADLGRLIAAAEHQAAGRRLAAVTCADIMARDLVTVGPEATVAEVARIFRQHRFTSVPVVDRGRLLGMIFQIHLIGMGGAIPVHEIMERALPNVSPAEPVGALLPILSQGRIDAIPVVEADRLVGIVTRTDLVAAMAQRLGTG